jgi:site-specific recombinase XerD
MDAALAELETGVSEEVAAELAELAEEAAVYLVNSIADNTRRAYQSDWRDFTSWCESHGRVALPASPDTVVLYLTALSRTHKPATIGRRIAALDANHEAAGYLSPTGAATVRKVLAGIRRRQGTAQRRARAFTVDDVQRIVREISPDGTLGARDRALVLVGFTGAFRRSELVGIHAEHVTFTGEGVKVTLPHSKTDQEGAGIVRAIPYGQHEDTCPVRALRAWIAAAGITSGPVFRRVDRWGNVGGEALTTKVVSTICKRYAQALGYDPAAYSAHSLRAGFATSAAAAGVTGVDIRRQTGHKSEAMLGVYIREANLFARHPVAALDL